MTHKEIEHHDWAGDEITFSVPTSGDAKLCLQVNGGVAVVFASVEEWDSFVDRVNDAIETHYPAKDEAPNLANAAAQPRQFLPGGPIRHHTADLRVRENGVIEALTEAGKAITSAMEKMQEVFNPTPADSRTYLTPADLPPNVLAFRDSRGRVAVRTLRDTEGCWWWITGRLGRIGIAPSDNGHTASSARAPLTIAREYYPDSPLYNS